MNNAQQNGLVVDDIGTEKDFNGLVVFGSEDDILQVKSTYESQLQALTNGTVRTMGHIVEALRSRLAILDTTLSQMF